jgi:hypothetical protein
MTSTIKVNNIQNQCGANIINENSNTITIGASGDTIALASGASQSGFGREGSVNWQTGSIKTAASFTAASGEGYFIDTSSNTITANLPAGSAGAIVAFSDYARNFATNKLTISPNGSEKIGGIAQDLDLEINGQALTLVYVDGTKGWINVQNAEDTETGVSPFIVASGGTESISGDFKIHTFTGPGSFVVTAAGTPGGSNTVDYLVIAGGGGGAGGKAYNSGTTGGGGAGGYRFSDGTASGSYCAGPSPLGASALPVPAQTYPIQVGGGAPAQVCSGPGTPGITNGIRGNPSTFSTITSTAGGGGKAGPSGNPLAPGGSGGGGNYENTAGGSGNTPPTSPAQGNDGGAGSSPFIAGGGGGAGGTGGAGGGGTSGGGGNGLASSITGSPVTRGGGGGGQGANATNPGPAGPGGGGAGGSPSVLAGDGAANTGGGGGAANSNPHPAPTTTTGAGGSGIVIIRYKFQ